MSTDYDVFNMEMSNLSKSQQKLLREGLWDRCDTYSIIDDGHDTEVCIVNQIRDIAGGEHLACAKTHDLVCWHSTIRTANITAFCQPSI